MSSSSASSKNLPAGGTSPIGRLSVELIHMIAWSLPRPDIDNMEVPMEAVEAWKAEQENHKTDLPPRPRELYPLARACKGFWHCLRPLLYHFDVIPPTMVFKLVSDPNDWVLYDRSSKGSALSWGIENNEMNTVKFAVDTARAVGDLGIYGSISHRRPSTAAATFFEEPAGAVVFVDALLQAVLHGNTAVVNASHRGCGCFEAELDLEFSQPDNLELVGSHGSSP